MKLGGLLEEGTKELGLRFSLLNLLPSLALFAFTLALAWSGAPAGPPDFSAVVGRLDELGTSDGICLGLGVLIFALVLQPLQFSIVRLLEGYWPGGPGGRWSAPGIRRHRRQREKIKRVTECSHPDPSPAEKAAMLAADWKLRRLYPRTDRVLPTALGNALRAAEDAPWRRYRLDGVVIWPRLYPLLPETMRAILGDRRTQLDVTVRLCVSGLLALAVAVIFLRGEWTWLAGFGVTLLLFAWLAYRGAVAAAIAYGEAVQVAFDLHRFALHDALKLPLPHDLSAERSLNESLSAFFRQNIDGDLLAIRYRHAEHQSRAKAAD